MICQKWAIYFAVEENQSDLVHCLTYSVAQFLKLPFRYSSFLSIL